MSDYPDGSHKVIIEDREYFSKDGLNWTIKEHKMKITLADLEKTYADETSLDFFRDIFGESGDVDALVLFRLLCETGQFDFANMISVSFGLQMPYLAAPSATIDPSATIGLHVRIGRGAIIKAGAILEADVSIGDFATIGEGARIESGACIGRNTEVAAKTRVKAY